MLKLLTLLPLLTLLNDGGDGDGGGDGNGGTSDGKPPADDGKGGGDGAGDGKTFSQEDLDRVVGERLARERSKYGDYDDLKAKAERLDELEAANKTELERLQDSVAERDRQIAERDERITGLEGTVLDLRLESSLVSAATKAGAVDPDAVPKLIDRGALELGDDGTPTNADEAVKTLLEERPYLRAPQRRGSGDQGRRGTTTQTADMTTMIRDRVRGKGQ